MSPRPGEAAVEITSRQDAARLEFDAQVRRFEDVRARLQETVDGLRNGRSQRQRLQESVYARLQARLDTMPVIEQAKGILMSQYRCPPEEAFDILRRASQNANVKISVLATQIVEQTSSPDPRPARQPPLPASGGRARKARVADLTRVACSGPSEG